MSLYDMAEQELRKRASGLTEGEQVVMDHLAAAWSGYVLLPTQHPADLAEFMGAVHELQRLLAVRVVRRAHPGYWRVDGDEADREGQASLGAVGVAATAEAKSSEVG